MPAAARTSPVTATSRATCLTTPLAAPARSSTAAYRSAAITAASRATVALQA